MESFGLRSKEEVIARELYAFKSDKKDNNSIVLFFLFRNKINYLIQLII